MRSIYFFGFSMKKERESRDAMECIQKTKKKKEKTWDGIFDDSTTALGVGAAVVLGFAAVVVASKNRRR